MEKVFAASEVSELLTKIQILDSDTACGLAYLLISASRQHHKVCSSQFPFLHHIKDTVAPREACLYGYITGLWHRQSSKSSLQLL